MFWARLISSVVLISGFIGILTLRSQYGLILFSIISLSILCLSIVEFTNILKKIDIKSNAIENTIISALIFISFLSTVFINTKFSQNKDLLLIIVAACSIYCWFLIIFANDRRKVLNHIIGIVLCAFLITIPLSFLSSIYGIGYWGKYDGIKLLLYLVMVTKAGDMGAYLLGVTTSKLPKGNHKIVPSISPKKSWEGAIGGILASIIVSILLGNLLEIENLQHHFTLLTLGIILFIGGFAGDLAESSLKRCSGIKDASNTIPGIGGVLDLVDSLLINAPMFYCILKGVIY